MLYWHGRRSAPTALSSVRPVARQCPAARKLWTSQWKSRGEQAKPKARKVHLWGKMDIILEKKCWSVFKHIATLWRRGREKIWSLMRITPKNIVLKLFYLSKSSMVDFFFNCNWASCTLTFSSTLPQSLPCCRVYKKKYLSALVTYTTLTFVSGILPDPNCD